MESRADPDILDSTEAGPRIIRGGALRTGGYFLGSGLAVVSAAVLTRYLGPADFGRYSVVFALLTVVAGLADAGTASLGVREFSVRRGEAGWHFLRHLLGIRLAIAALGVAGAIAFATLAGYDSAMVAGTAAGGVGLLLLVVWGTLAIPLYSALRLGWVTNLDLLRQALTVVALIALVGVGAGIVPLLAVPIPVALVLIVVTGILIERRRGLGVKVDRSEWRGILKLILPFAAATTAGILYAHVSVLALSLVGSERETGLFAAAFRVYFVLAAIPGLVVSSAFPLLARAARDDQQRLRYAVQLLFEVCLVAGAGMALLLAVGAPVALDVVAGPGYSDATEELRLLAIALMGTFVIALGGFALLSLERYRALMWANLAGLLLSAGLTLALGPNFGETAGAIAVAAGDVTLAVVYVAVLGRGREGIRLQGRVVPKVLVAAAVASTPLLVPAIPVIVQTILVGALFTVAVVALRALPLELRQAVPGLR